MRGSLVSPVGHWASCGGGQAHAEECKVGASESLTCRRRAGLKARTLTGSLYGSLERHKTVTLNERSHLEKWLRRGCCVACHCITEMQISSHQHHGEDGVEPFGRLNFFFNFPKGVRESSEETLSGKKGEFGCHASSPQPAKNQDCCPQWRTTLTSVALVMNYKLCEENKTLLPFMGHKFLLPFLEISSFSNLVPFEDVRMPLLTIWLRKAQNKTPQSHWLTTEFYSQKRLFRIQFSLKWVVWWLTCVSCDSKHECNLRKPSVWPRPPLNTENQPAQCLIHRLTKPLRSQDSESSEKPRWQWMGTFPFPRRSECNIWLCAYICKLEWMKSIHAWFMSLNRAHIYMWKEGFL